MASSRSSFCEMCGWLDLLILFESALESRIKNKRWPWIWEVLSTVRIRIFNVHAPSKKLFTMSSSTNLEARLWVYLSSPFLGLDNFLHDIVLSRPLSFGSIDMIHYFIPLHNTVTENRPPPPQVESFSLQNFSLYFSLYRTVLHLMHFRHGEETCEKISDWIVTLPPLLSLSRYCCVLIVCVGT